MPLSTDGWAPRAWARHHHVLHSVPYTYLLTLLLLPSLFVVYFPLVLFLLCELLVTILPANTAN